MSTRLYDNIINVYEIIWQYHKCLQDYMTILQMSTRLYDNIINVYEIIWQYYKCLQDYMTIS